MNEKPKDRALADRLSYVKIDDYTEKEKCVITERYLLPKALKNVGLTEKDILFSSHDIIKSFVRKLSPGSSGIRKLKEAMGNLISKILFNINNQAIDTSFTLNREKYSKKNLVFPFKITEDIITYLLSDMIQKTLDYNICISKKKNKIQISLSLMCVSLVCIGLSQASLKRLSSVSLSSFRLCVGLSSFVSLSLVSSVCWSFKRLSLSLSLSLFLSLVSSVVNVVLI